MVSFADFKEVELNGETVGKEYICDRVDGIYVSIPDQLANKAIRHAEIRKHNHRNHNKSDFNDDADLIGLYGECIFATKYNLEVDWELKLKDEYDFKVDGHYIDVKSTEYSPYLTVKYKKLRNEFVYIWCPCRLKHNDGKIVGWLMGSQVAKIGDLITKKNGEKLEEPYYRVPYLRLNKN